MHKLLKFLVVITIATSILLRIDFIYSIRIGFDEAWHIFIARQDSWQGFWEAMGLTVHPPIYFLLLKFISPLIDDINNFRWINFTFFLFWLLLIWLICKQQRFSSYGSFLALILAAHSFGLFHISLVVRGYMLSIVMSSAAFLFFLKAADNKKYYLASIFFALLACLTHLSQLFFVAALASFCLASSALDYLKNKKLELWKITYCLTLLVIGYGINQYYSSENKFFMLHYLADFLYQEGSILEFAWLNTNRIFLFLFPKALLSNFVLNYPLALIFVLTIFCLPQGKIIFTKSNYHAPLILLLLMLALNLIASLLYKYPFGGDLRHTSFLFPFIILSVATLADFLWNKSTEVIKKIILVSSVLLLFPWALKTVTLFAASTTAPFYYPTNFWHLNTAKIDLSDDNQIYFISGYNFLTQLEQNNLLDNTKVSLEKTYPEFNLSRIYNEKRSILVAHEKTYGDYSLDKKKVESFTKLLLKDFPEFKNVKVYLLRKSGK